MSVLPPPEEKATFVHDMFAAIAHRYDATNRVMTLGMDQSWREEVVQTIAPPIDGRVLDVGTGTGDFLPLLAAWIPDGMAVGVDFCLPMMQTGYPKLTAATSAKLVAFVGGDVLSLPFADETFDAITTGFLMRNVTDIHAAFREMWRVARPGGSLACLEVARPRHPLLRVGHWTYLQIIVPWIGRLMSRHHQAYTYLPQSARIFPHPQELALIMNEAGWQTVTYRYRGLGAVAIHSGIKR